MTEAPTIEETAAGPLLQPTSFQALAGWQDDRQGAAMAAFKKSCARLMTLPPQRRLGKDPRWGSVQDWQPVCASMVALDASDDAGARQFFETHFQPFQILSANGEATGLFTGYFDAQLKGNWRQSDAYPYPIYATPGDLIEVDLGDFSASLAGRQIVGRLHGDRFLPYHDRRAIDHGALAGQGLELLYVSDAIDAFFLQIQGSGRVAMADGTALRLGYAQRNGHRYVAIGRTLIERGALAPDRVSMQSIRRWLQDHPRDAFSIMHENPSYVFFRQYKEDEGPFGAQGVVLTAQRSIAVDRHLFAYGLPIWLESHYPTASGGEQPLQRLLIAQDTGGAIRGAVRGDVFWGYGAEAEAIAGAMQHRGRWTVLLPKNLAAAV